jgi:Na+-transporting methylmalonyl-CoA/oxaloacetate decarboxylase beta subunit
MRRESDPMMVIPLVIGAMIVNLALAGLALVWWLK